MTTKLLRSIRRETTIREPRTRRPYIITLEIGGSILRIRLKGLRQSYAIPLERIWYMGAAIKAQELRAEKIARRKEKKS